MTPEKQLSVKFDSVFRSELEWIEKRRIELRQSDKLPAGDAISVEKIDVTSNDALQQLETEALKADLCGLAISGGGIRSATFSLGVLQGLAATGLLPRFDYLSTVSGGGYIGSWFSTWVNREGFSKVEKQLLPPRMQLTTTSAEVEPEPVRHLRLYSNYLAPRPGLFSFDGWVIIAISLRNLLLNQMVLLLAMLGVFIGIRTIVEGFSLSHKAPSSDGLQLVFSVLALEMFAWANVGAAIYAPGGVLNEKVGFTISRFWLNCIIPWLLAAMFVSLLFVSKSSVDWLSKEKFGTNLLITAIVFGVSHGVLGCTAFSRRWRAAWVGFMTGAGGGAVLFLAWSYLILTSHEHHTTVAAIATFGVPLSLAIYVFTNFLMVGLCGPELKEMEREWWSSMNSRLMMIATAWAILFVISVYGPWLVGQALMQSNNWYAYATGTAGIGWLTTLLAGLKASQGAGTNSTSRGGFRENLARIAPVLFLITLALGISVMTTWIAYDVYAGMQDEPSPSLEFRQRYSMLLVDMNDPKWPVSILSERFPLPILGVLSVSTMLLMFGSHWLGLFVGVNTFSLQNLYANRLVRCYLGASKNKRTPDPIVNMDSDDDINFSALFPGQGYISAKERKTRASSAPDTDGDDEKNEGYSGPIHIVNGALNQKASAIRSKGGRNKDGKYSAEEVKAEKLQFVERQAESFVFTPLYCGSEATGYCPTEKFAGNIKLGTAVAVSGAAVTPNMGYHSSPAITALLTVFNIRLGAWFGNPRCESNSNPNPAASAWLLMQELAGMTDSESDYVYVSDGGHFENMGVYELIRRRCRFIFAVDVGGDPQFHENVGRVIRQVRIDFGIHIDVDMAPVSPGPDGKSQSHVVVGRIHYGDVNRTKDYKDPNPLDPNYEHEQNHGIIVWLKNSLTGDEPGDLANHAAMNPSFPYDTIADQFFSESQFESYRALGYHSAMRSIILPSKSPSKPTASSPYRYAGAEQIAVPTKDSASKIISATTNEIFKGIYDFWLTKPAQFLTGYIHQNEAYAKIQASLRQNEKLRRLAMELYGTEKEKIEAVGSIESGFAVEERLMVNEMLTMLESVFFELDLERQSLHPVHAGWMGVFKHWSKSESFKKCWADENATTENGLFREYSPSFCRFMDKMMDLVH